MGFPKCIEISLANDQGIPILFANVFFGAKIFASSRNDYYTGPYWTNNNGIFRIIREEVEEDMQADRELFLMDYQSTLDQCKPLVEVRVLDENEIRGICEGTAQWGLMGPDRKKWKTAEEKIAFIRQNNNHLVHPGKMHIDLSGVSPTDVIQRTFVTELLNNPSLPKAPSA